MTCSMDDLSTNPSHIIKGKLQNGSKCDAEFPAVITNGCSQEPQQSYIEVLYAATEGNISTPGRLSD